MNNSINEQDLCLFENDCDSRDMSSILRHTITKNGINASCIDEDLLKSLSFTFSVDLETGAVCNQKQSGRCWLFAGLNVLRTILMKNLNVDDIELSQSYLQFFDKLEKSNFFLESVIELAGEEPDSRLNMFMLDSGLGDGGHFVMFTNLVKKYGVVPIGVMPDLSVSTSTGELNQVLTGYLAQAMMELREAKNKGASKLVLRRMKEGYLNDVYRILSLSLGKPVPSFSFDYRSKDKEKTFHHIENITPKEFYEQYIKADLDQYVALCDSPLPRMKNFQKYTCHFVNNVEDGDPVIFFHAGLKAVKDATIRSLKAGEPVWFGSDVLAQSMRKEGYLASDILKTDSLFSLHNRMKKGDRLTYRTSFCNHAMTFTGVNLPDGERPNRWKVENSWGKDCGKNGYFVMNDAWFDDYVYEVFIRREFVDAEILKAYDASSILEEDPFDTLWAEMK